MKITAHQFARMLDATLTGAVATEAQTREMMALAKQHDFYSVIGPRCYIPMMIEEMKGSNTLVGAGVSFITGADPTEVLEFFTKLHVASGVQEIEMIMNMSFMKSGLYDRLQRDVRVVRDNCPGLPMKCILEVCYLDDKEIAKACDLLIDCGVDYIKTSTGKAGPTTLHHIDVMAKAIRGRAKIKASGGIRTIETVEQMYDLGAERFGIGVENAMKIIQQANAR